jgi:tRNA pseudouridine38-40 synthase
LEFVGISGSNGSLIVAGYVSRETQGTRRQIIQTDPQFRNNEAALTSPNSPEFRLAVRCCPEVWRLRLLDQFPMRNIRLTLAYDGSPFAGWQVQPDARTVQGELEAAILRLTGEDVRVLSAGRTDAGVHALGQVASFQTSSTIPGDKWRPALQGHLPPEIVVRRSEEATAEFHATFSATSKRYRYVILNSLVDDPFLRRYAWRLNGPLDDAAMCTAAECLRGTHDFRCFETDWPNKATSVRTVLDVRLRRLAQWSAWSDDPGTDAPSAPIESPFLIFEIEADGFLYNMVRSIVGTLVNIGRGRWPVEAMRQIIDGQDRTRAGETAPAEGLYLVRVRYDGVPRRPMAAR